MDQGGSGWIWILDGSEWGWVDLNGPGLICVDLVDLSGSGWKPSHKTSISLCKYCCFGTKHRFRCVDIAVFKKGSQKALVFDTLSNKIVNRLGFLRRGRLKYRFLRR